MKNFKVTRKGIKLRLERPLSAQEIWNKIMDIQIQALKQLLEEKSLDKWENLFPSLGTSLDYAETLANSYIMLFESARGDVYENNFDSIVHLLLNQVTHRWFNTLMSTLYMMEGELMKTSSESVFELWDLFFTVQTERKCNYISAMELNDLELK